MADQKVPVSLIITTYNDAEYLPKALDSVLNQSCMPAEVIVVDDGSKSNEAKIVTEKYKKNISSICFFKKENGGPSSARNYGINEASQDYITFLDADDYMLKENLSNLYSMAKDLPDSYFGVYGDYVSSRTNKVVAHRNVDGVPSTSLVGRNNGIPGCVYTYLLKKERLLEVDGFDESLTHNEDFDLLIKLIKKGYFLKGSAGAGVYRNYRLGSLTRSDKAYANYEAISIFLDKAEKNNYFDDRELKKRRKSNNLSLAKKLHKSGSSLNEVKKALEDSFAYAKPEGAREYIAYILSKTF